MACYNINGLIKNTGHSITNEVKAMCLQHHIQVMALTETHLKSPDQETNIRSKGLGYFLFNSLHSARKACKGTAIFHFLNNAKKRFITNIVLVPGCLQWTRFYSRNIPINILTVYLSGRSDDSSNESEVINSLIETLLEIENEHIIVTGDFNINTTDPVIERDKEWISLMEILNLHEFKSDNYTYIRRNNGRVTRSRPDHTFVSDNIRVVKEVILAPISKNDHLPYYLDLEFTSDLSWRSYFCKKNKKLMLEKLNSSVFSNFDELYCNIQSLINKYGKRTDRLGINRVVSSYNKEIHDLEYELIDLIHDDNATEHDIINIQSNIKKLYKESAIQIKEKLTDRFNNFNSSSMYRFDSMVHNKQINWKEFECDEKEIINYFHNKFTTCNKEVTFTPSTSTIATGPKYYNVLNLNDLEEAISRMRSNTPGIDQLSLDIIKGLNDHNKKLIVDEFNKSLLNKDIPLDWKKGWVKLIPKREVSTFSDIRPITIMPILYRILFNIIAFNIRTWASVHINIRQQAFITSRNTFYHGIILAALAIKHKDDFMLVNLDIEGAYDSVELEVIKIALTHCKFPTDFIDFIINSYSNHELCLEIDNHLTNSFEKTRGIPQGCPLAPLIYDCITQLIIDKTIDVWKIPKEPSVLDINTIALLCFADDMNIICNKEINYNSRLDDINLWLSQLLFKLNANKSVATVLPINNTMKPKVNNVNIPIKSNIRILGHYPWNDKIVNEDIEKKIDKFELSLKYLPLRKLEPHNLGRILHAKVISLFTHLSKTNSINIKYQDKIDKKIRETIKRKLHMDLRTPTSFFHLPLVNGGLGLPSISEFTDRLNIKTLMQMANRGGLLKEAFEYGLEHRFESEGNIFREWKKTLIKYKIDFAVNDLSFSLPTLDGSNFQIHTDGSRMDDRTGMGIIIYNDITPSYAHSFSLRLCDNYSNNIAEICSIITAIHMIPSNSSINIHTDSKVAIQVFNKKYNGMFRAFNEQYLNLVNSKGLRVKLTKVKAHVHPENIKVDQLAKDSIRNDDIFDIKQLFPKIPLLIRDGIIIYDHKQITLQKHLEKMLTKVEDNSNFITTTSWSSINVRYLKHKISPNYKYAVWRNSNSSHIRHFKGSYCNECDIVSNLEHYIYDCPLMDSARFYCESKISNLLNMNAELSPRGPNLRFYPNIFYMNHTGTIRYESFFCHHIQCLADIWPEVQVILALFVGRCHKQYYIDKEK